MKSKSLKRDDRGLSHYHSLKNDLKNDSDRIATSLPLFIRVMFFDKPNDWVKKINRFDFLRLVCLDTDFPSMQNSIDSDIDICSNIYPRNKKYTELSLNEFFNSEIIRIKNHKITIQEFIFAVGYNGGIHMIPDKSKDTHYNLIYKAILEPESNLSFDLITQISKVFIDVFEEYELLLNGDKDAHSRNHQFQPMIMRNGQLLDGTYFNHAYIQLAVITKKQRGLAIISSVKVSTDINWNNIILSYGHRENDDLSIRVFQNGENLFYELLSKGKSKILRADISKFNNVFFEFEVSFFPDGKMSIAINKIQIDSFDWKSELNIIDGKIIVGSNLSGNNFGEFYEKGLEILTTEKSGNKTRYRYYP